MVDYIVREALGPHGRVILDFCLEHSFIISAIILFFGIIIVSANNNLQNLVKKAYELSGSDNGADMEAVLNGVDVIFWDSLKEFSKFPFIALSFSLIPYPVNQDNLKKLLSRHFDHLEKTKLRAKKKEKIKT